MSYKRAPHGDLLRSLLSVILKEWPYDEVNRILAEIEAANGLSTETTSENCQRSRRKPEKPSAKLLADRISLPPEQKRLVQILAEKFDAKQFLPTSGDIRYFFEIYGQEEPRAKHRSEAFRKILRLLSTMPESSLKKVIEDDAHSGPVRLGPLSDAMRGVGEQRSVERLSAFESPDHRANDQGKPRSEEPEKPGSE